jgi:hypothetical protein
VNKHLRYAWYILRHKWFVFLACCRLGIPLAGIVHDGSKLRPSEWRPYADRFYGGKRRRWADIHGDERNHYPYALTEEGIAEAFDRAWLLHQHRNPHHWQHWVLREDSGATKALAMPTRYLYEMIADWRGAGRAVGKPDTAAWYLKNRDQIILHPDTRKRVECLLGVPSVRHA